MQRSPARAGGGRPSKGERRLLSTRPPLVIAEEVLVRADARGMTISDYVAAVLAEHVGKSELAPMSPVLTHQELALTG